MLRKFTFEVNTIYSKYFLLLYNFYFANENAVTAERKQT